MLSCVFVAVAVMFSFRAIHPLPTDQDIESESNLLAFSIAVDKEKCCDQTTGASFMLHTAAHRVCTAERLKSERDVCNDMLAVLQENSICSRMIARKCNEYMKAFPHLAQVQTMKQFREMLAQGDSLDTNEPMFLYVMALATGMHIAIFFKFTVWTTRAISGEIGCSLRFAKLPGGRWVHLKDADPTDLYVAQPLHKEEPVQPECPVMPMSSACETVVKKERGESGSTLADDLLAAYEAAFPQSDTAEVELDMKEVVCDQQLLAHPVVLIERMRDERSNLEEAAVMESDANAALVPLSGVAKMDSVQTCSDGRCVKKVWGVATRSMAKKKNKTSDKSCVSVSNIVSESRHATKCQVVRDHVHVSPQVLCRCTNVALCIVRSVSTVNLRAVRSMCTRNICVRSTHCMFATLHCVPVTGFQKELAKHMKNFIALQHSDVMSVVGIPVGRQSSTDMC